MFFRTTGVNRISFSKIYNSYILVLSTGKPFSKNEFKLTARIFFFTLIVILKTSIETNYFNLTNSSKVEITYRNFSENTPPLTFEGPNRVAKTVFKCISKWWKFNWFWKLNFRAVDPPLIHLAFGRNFADAFFTS